MFSNQCKKKEHIQYKILSAKPFHCFICGKQTRLSITPLLWDRIVLQIHLHFLKSFFKTSAIRRSKNLKENNNCSDRKLP